MYRHFFAISYFFFGITLYSPVFFAGFAADDYNQLVKPPFFHSLHSAITSYWSVIASVSGHTIVTGFFYRPFIFMTYSLLYCFTQGNPLYFHILQLLTYLAGVYLLFFLFTSFFPNQISGILAFIFLIHPANNELGAYIAALSDTFCFFFGILTLVIIFKSRKITFSIVIFASLSLLGALLSKETGILFAVLLSLYLIYKKHIAYLWTVGTTVCLYFICRIYASFHVILFFNQTPTLHYGFLQKILIGIQISATIIREIFIPSREPIDSSFFRPLFTNTLLPILLLFVVLLCMIISCVWIKKYHSEKLFLLLFFYAWILLGVVFYIQIVPLEVLFAERWLYITEIGIAGTIGIVLQVIPLKKNKWYYVCLSMGICILLLYGAHTFRLNLWWLDWRRHMV